MQLLVTGGAGFIGGHLAESFVGDGHDVTVLDSFEPFYDLGLKEHNVDRGRVAAESGDGAYELVRGDVRDEELVDDVDVVYHQAAQAGVRTASRSSRPITTRGCTTRCSISRRWYSGTSRCTDRACARTWRSRTSCRGA